MKITSSHITLQQIDAHYSSSHYIALHHITRHCTEWYQLASIRIAEVRCIVQSARCIMMQCRSLLLDLLLEWAEEQWWMMAVQRKRHWDCSQSFHHCQPISTYRSARTCINSRACSLSSTLRDDQPERCRTRWMDGWVGWWIDEWMDRQMHWLTYRHWWMNACMLDERRRYIGIGELWVDG